MAPDPARRFTRFRAAVLAVLGLALAAGIYLAAAGGPDLSGEGEEADLRAQGTYNLLCDTRWLAETNPTGARDLFFGRVHWPLHEIADRVAGVDRTVAARFLEAKNDVEATLNRGAPVAELSAALDSLLQWTEQALRSLGVTTPDCDLP